jgi:hypothetical protein
MLINLFLALIVGVMQSAPANPSGGSNVIPKTAEPQTVEFCELLRKAKDYKDKEVRVRALYRTDFEESSLHSPHCYVPLYVWVKFDPALRGCDNRGAMKKLDKKKWGMSVDVVFIGRLETDGHYGHMDMYSMQFIVTCVEDVKPLGSFRPLPDQKKNSSPKAMSNIGR